MSLEPTHADDKCFACSCWFLSSLACLCGHEDGLLVRQLFPGQYALNPKGACVVRLCVAGRWELIAVDDRFVAAALLQLTLVVGGSLQLVATVITHSWHIAPLPELACGTLCAKYYCSLR